MYALVEIAGKQFKLEENSQVKIPYNNNKVGDKINFDKVLYFDDGAKKTIGNPYVSGLSIDGKVLSHGKEPKIIVFLVPILLINHSRIAGVLEPPPTITTPVKSSSSHPFERPWARVCSNSFDKRIVSKQKQLEKEVSWYKLLI